MISNNPSQINIELISPQHAPSGEKMNEKRKYKAPLGVRLGQIYSIGGSLLFVKFL